MNKKMRVFPEGMPDYEKVFTSRKYLGRFDISRVNNPDGFKDLNQYKETLRDFLWGTSLSVWDMTVQTEWLFSKFKYDGTQRGRAHKTVGVQSRTAFSVFTKEYVGINPAFVSYSFFSKNIKSYFSELFPDFKKDNPFINPEKFKYPFTHVTIDFMLLVYQMPERMELLMCAERSKMNFTTFIDFVINYIGKSNDLEGKDLFQIVKTKRFPLYVKVLK